MGRPRIYEEPRVATAIRLPTSLRDELQAAAAERDVSVNFLVTRAVLDYLGRLPAVSDEPSRPRRTARRATLEATS
jgi:predicted transcriptional regulator